MNDLYYLQMQAANHHTIYTQEVGVWQIMLCSHGFASNKSAFKTDQMEYGMNTHEVMCFDALMLN